MVRTFLRIMLILSSSLSLFDSSSWVYASSYTPGAEIALTGSSDEVFFDVADDIFVSGSTVGYPRLLTASARFSGAFYLSGAGWIDFSTGSYIVSLDCGIQSLSSLTTPCTLSGVAYGEIIGDVLFDRRVSFDPLNGLLSGTATTYIGEYRFDSLILPLLPVEFEEGTRVVVDQSRILTLSGAYRYDGPGSWRIHIEPSGGSDILYTGSPYDLSHASLYRVEIIDPNNSSTVINDFEAVADIPATSLGTTAGTVREAFCIANPASSVCPDGATLKPTELSKTVSATPVVGNGDDTYGFILRLRDTYGNMVDTGSLRVDYTDTIRDIQDIGPFPYVGLGAGWALVTSGDLHNYLDGTPTTGDIPANMGGIAYTIASLAPTSAVDTLTLSGVIYTDTTGTSTDISVASWKTPLSFDPWYTTSLASGPIVVGEIVDFTTTFMSATPLISPLSPTAVYDIAIGANSFASMRDFSSAETISCTKYILSPGTGECDWFGSPDPVIISSTASAFSGIYTPAGFDPPPEILSYRSYITYEMSGIRILYPTASSTLGTATAGTPRMKILGQHNLPSGSNGGIGEKNTENFWNLLHKKTALFGRNRTSYSDTDYTLSEGDISLSNVDFIGPAKKRTFISIGGDITITGDILSRDTPVAFIALTDRDGNGGEILIASGVTDIYATLIAEKSIFSTGASQLYIYGSVISHNSVSNTVCPYYVSLCSDPKSYNLENLRASYLTAPEDISAYSTTTGKYTNIPLIIEYDGRVLSDPPPGLLD